MRALLKAASSRPIGTLQLNDGHLAGDHVRDAVDIERADSGAS
jgi:hypothetical protein